MKIIVRTNRQRTPFTRCAFAAKALAWLAMPEYGTAAKSEGTESASWERATAEGVA